jgi:hypothetical protein
MAGPVDCPQPDHSGPAVQLATSKVVPKSKPQIVRQIEPAGDGKVSLLELESERGDTTECLTLRLDLLPGGRISTDLGVEETPNSLGEDKDLAIRHSTNYLMELDPQKQVIDIAGASLPSIAPGGTKQSWVQRLFRKKEPGAPSPRIIVRLTIEPVVGSEHAVEARGKSLQLGKSALPRRDTVLTEDGKQELAQLASIPPERLSIW